MTAAETIVIIVPPFRAPTAPALGPAALKSAVERRLPGVTLVVDDVNVELVRRASDGALPDLCARCPVGGLACPRPGLLGARMPWVREQLRTLPTTSAQQDDHMRAAVLLDGLFNTLLRCAEALLRPYAEGRAPLPEPVREAWLAPLLDRLTRARPTFVGLSVLSEQSLLWALALGRFVKEELETTVALGGALLSHLDPRELLGAAPWVDLAFIGEAEGSLPAYLERRGGELEAVPGLAHREDGRVCVHRPDHDVVLDDLPPPDFSDAPLDDYLVAERILPYSASRGCSWRRCRFCTHPRPHGRRVRSRRAEKVVADLETLERQTGAKAFLFVDENIRARRVRALAEALLAAGASYLLGFEGIRPEASFTASVLGEARRAGLRWMYVGLESVTQRLLDLIDKGTRVEDIEAFLERCDEAGIVTHCSYIVGLPTQRLGELDDELGRMRGKVVDGGPFTLLWGSVFHREAERYGLRADDREVLLLGEHGRLHGPSVRYTSEGGVGREVAEARYQAHDVSRRHRPHLGECDAVVLSQTSFFDDSERPAELARLVEETRRSAASSSGGGVLDRLACLEAEGRFDEALELARGALRGAGRSPMSERLTLHVATNLIEAGDLSEAARLLARLLDDPDVGAAAAGQLMRAALGAGDMTSLDAAARRLWRRGIVTHRVCLGLGLVAMSSARFEEAARHLSMAAALGPANPDLDALRAELLEELGRDDEAATLRGRAERRRRALQPPA